MASQPQNPEFRNKFSSTRLTGTMFGITTWGVCTVCGSVLVHVASCLPNIAAKLK